MATNLQFIKSVSATSGVTSLSITDVFSSNYDVYQITFSNLQGITTEDYVDFTFLNSSGSEITTSNYSRAHILMLDDTGFVGDFKEDQANFDRFLYLRTFTSAGESAGGNIYVYNPFTSSFTFFTGQSAMFNDSTPRLFGIKTIGVLKETTSITGFKLTVEPSGELDRLEVNVYGVK
jgi:hypothetical protein